MSSAYSSSALSSHRRPPPDESSGDEGEDADEFYDPQEYPDTQHNTSATSAATAPTTSSLKPTAQRSSDEKELSSHTSHALHRPMDSSTRSTRSQSTASQSSSFFHHTEPASPSPDTLPSLSSLSPSTATQRESPSSSPVPPGLTPAVPPRPGRNAVVISTASTMCTPSPSPALATPSSSTSSSSSSASSAFHSHHVRSASFNMPAASPATSPMAVSAVTPMHYSAAGAGGGQLLSSSDSSTSLNSLIPLQQSPHNQPLPATSSPTTLTTTPHASHTTPLTLTTSLPTLPASSSYSHSSMSPSVSLSGQSEGAVIRNLDTNESCQLSAAHSHFPELSAAMTIAQLEALEEHRASKEKESAVIAATAGSAVSAAMGTAEEASLLPEPKITESEVVERRKTLGFLGKLAKTFAIPAMKPTTSTGGEGRVKVKAKHCEVDVLSELYGVQTIVEHTGPIWAVAVSHDGQFVATGGQDSCVRVWVVVGSMAHKQMESKQQQQQQQQHSNAPTPHHSHHPSSASTTLPPTSSSPTHLAFPHPDDHTPRMVLHPVPYRVYSGHRADVTSLDFSKDENFLLSASIDKTVRLWHASSSRCIRIFPHPEIVTSVCFHPIQHRYFISGSFDNRIRLWNILEHRVVEWAQTAHFVTAVTFSPSGAMVVAGLHHGQCVFYQTNGLKYYTQIDCRNRSGKFKKGKKITGLEYNRDGKLLLVSTNDSRVRCYRLVDFSLVCKMKGVENEQLQIRATWSEDGQYVVMGSDKEYVAVWRMPERAAGGGSVAVVGGSSHSGSGGSDKERSKTTSQNSRSTSVSTPSATSPLSPLSPLTQTITSPTHPTTNQHSTSSSSPSSSSSSSSSLKLDAFEYFRAMDDTVTCAIFLPRSTLAWSSANEGAYVMPLRSIVLTTGLGGEMKVFENRLARPTGQHSSGARR